MNKRGLLICFLLAGSLVAKAQTFGGHRQGYISISNYNGNSMANAITLVLDGQNTVNMPNWRITARVTGQIPTDGKIFPADKLSLQPNSTQGTANPSPVPSVSQIGFYPNVVLSTSEQDLVTQSNAPVYNTGGYYRWEFRFNWTVLGGSYLNNLQAWKEYKFTIEFRFYNNNNQLMGSVPLDHTVQVGNLGNPPVQNNFSLMVNGGARNGTLTLQSRSDYENGANVSYSNGLTVNTNAAYQVTVNASSGTPHFSYGSNIIDLDVLNVKLNTTASGVTSLNTVTLSTGAQVIAKGGSTSNQNINFDVGYFINLANKDKLLYAFKDKQQSETTYTTTLQYTILAQ